MKDDDDDDVIHFPSSEESWGKITHCAIYASRNTWWNKVRKVFGLPEKTMLVFFTRVDNDEEENTFDPINDTF